MADEELGAENGAEAEAGEEDILDTGAAEGGEGHEEQGSEASEEDRYAESLATELNWAPKDQWRGDPADWKPARDFLKDTVSINKARGREIKQLKDTVDRIARTSATMAERAAAEARSEAEARFRKAVDDGDEQAAFRASQDLQAITAQGAPERPAAAVEFFQKHEEILNAEPTAGVMLEHLGAQLAKRGVSPEVQVEEAEKLLRRRFPEYFEEQRPPNKQPAAVNAPGSRAPSNAKRGPKGFADLPPEAKAAAQDFKRRGRIGDVEEYAKIYWQENA